MGKMATLAKPADPAPNQPPDVVAQLRCMVLRILQEEYGGSTGIWEQAAKRATTRILAAIEGVTASCS